MFLRPLRLLVSITPSDSHSAGSVHLEINVSAPSVTLQRHSGGSADVNASLICSHLCFFITSLCLLDPSIPLSEANIFRELGVTAVDNAQLWAFYWASVSIYIKTPPEAKANIDVWMLCGMTCCSPYHTGTNSWKLLQCIFHWEH